MQNAPPDGNVPAMARHPRPPGGGPAPLLFFLLCLSSAIVLKTAVHQVPEGYVAVYWRGGKLLNRITDPGLHLKMPFGVDSFELVQITMQTDKVSDILCGTKGGVTISFDKIEVVNRLKKEHVYDTIKEYGVHYDKTWIYDKIHHEINQFCSFHSLQEVYIDKFDQVDEKIRDALQADIEKYAPGIEIISVRVTKPRIPDNIMRNYEAMEVERTKALVALERQKVVDREIEVERRRAIAEAERASATSAILQAQLLAEKEAARAQASIANEMYMAQQRALADAAAYAATKDAEGWRAKLTPEYLELVFLQSIANNTKMFFGDKIPAMVLEQRLVGGVFDGIQGAGSVGGGVAAGLRRAAVGKAGPAGVGGVGAAGGAATSGSQD